MEKKDIEKNYREFLKWKAYNKNINMSFKQRENSKISNCMNPTKSRKEFVDGNSGGY